MQKWEYAELWSSMDLYSSAQVYFSHREEAWDIDKEMRERKVKGDHLLYALRRLGGDAWECVGSMVGGHAAIIFKRPLE